MKRIAIVTGAAQGIGFAIANKLAHDDHFVVLTDIDSEKATRASESIGQDRAVSIQCDIGNERDVSSLFANVIQRYGAVSAVINNAGIVRDRVIWKMAPEEFDVVVRVNLRGTWLMCREAAIHMREQKQGAIVNITSRAWLGNPGQTNYSASKAGIVGLTRSLALELGPRNVRVNAVAPGLIDTPLAQGLPEDVRAKLIAAQPTRAMGTPEDVAETVAFLASEKAHFITGQVIYVDGGKSIGAGV